jgi:hypothetical protein
MTDYASLKAEIAKPEYSVMTDAQIATAINAKTTVIAVNMSHKAVRDMLIFTTAGDWGRVVGIADGVITAGISQATRIRAISLRELFRGGMNDFYDSSIVTRWNKLITAIDALIIDTVLTQESKTEIIALGHPTVLLTSTWGWPNGIDVSEIAVARNYT